MTYNVFSGTLNPTHSLTQLNQWSLKWLSDLGHFKNSLND